jgi:hypothetical protein
MSVTIHFCSETSAWRYLIPALFNFSESSFNWEICRYSQGFLLASKHLLIDNQEIFSVITPGCEPYVEKWLKLNGAPSTKIAVYCWGTRNESPIKSIPFIQIPILRDDLNGFLLHLKSVHPLRSLRSLLNERAIHPRDRIRLREILSEKLTAALGRQLDTASLLQPSPPNSIEEEASPTQDEFNDFGLEPLVDRLPQPKGDQPQPIAKAVNVPEPVEDQQPVIEEDTEDHSTYEVEDVYEDFTESEHCPHWSISFADNPHLPILTHIDQYGCITEAEIINLLDNSRAARNFTLKLDMYKKVLPFDIKIQPSPSGSRYTKSYS